MKSKLLFCARAMTAAICVAAVAAAQTTGRIDGIVRLSDGGPVAGASVEARGLRTPGSRSAVTDAKGRYHLPELSPGTYEVRAFVPGFRTANRQIVVSLGTAAAVDFTLDPAAREDVVVSGETPPIDTASAAGGTHYTSRIVAKLPVDRNYADIVRANPAVDTDRGDTQGRSLALTIDGATSAENQWIIDGVNTTSVIKGVQGKAINNEFVEEVEVKSDGYSAEYGRALGGIVNVVTKSGGNELHGDAFVYADSSGTAAREVFTPGETSVFAMRLADSRRADYGAALGGFLVRDQLWFFAAYDRVDSRSEVSRAEPSAHVTTGDRFPLDVTDNLYSGKLTWNASPSTTVVGTVFADPSTISGAAGADPRQGPANLTPIVSLDPSTWSSTRKIGGADESIRITEVPSSRTLLTLQASLHRDRYELLATDTVRLEDDMCAGGTPDPPCGFPLEPNAVTGGFGGVSGRDDRNSSERRQLQGDVTLYSGDHEFKAGGDFHDGRTHGIGYFTGGQQVFVRNEYGQLYYAHQFVAVSADDPTPTSGYHLGARVLDYGAFVEDAWKPAAGLSLNLGLRWDGEDTQSFRAETVLRFRDEWQPRIGVAWDPWRDGRSKVYASAGRFSYGLPTILAVAAFHGFTLLETYNFDPVGVTQDPNVMNHCEAMLIAGGGSIGDPVDPGLRPMYQDEFTLGFERSLDPTLTVGLKGIYRRLGAAIEERCDFISTSTNNTCALINPGSSGPYASGDAPVHTGFDGDTSQFATGPPTPPARRLYRAIEVTARKSAGDRLWLQASYVYSSLRGNYDGGVNQTSYGQTSVGTNSDFDYPTLWHNASGTLSLDRPHRFRLDGFWVTPWRLTVGLQAYAESGTPLNRFGYFNGKYGSAVFLVPRGSAGRLPTLWESSLTLSYPIAVGPVSVTLQAYIFNLFNNQIVTSRDEAWSINPPKGYPATVEDSNQPSDNPDYGKATSRQAPRSLRGAVRVSF